MGGEAWSFKDPTGRMKIEEILRSRAKLFRPPRGNAPSEALQRSRDTRFWLALDMASVEELTRENWSGPLVLTIEDARVRRVELYERSGGGLRRERWDAEEDRSATGGGLRYPVFLLDPRPAKPRELFLAIESDAAVSGVVRVSDFQSFVATYDGETLLLAFVIGIRSAILVYILALGTILRSRTNLWLAAMIATGLVQIACDNALLETVLFEEAARLSRTLSFASVFLGQFFFIGFAASVLRLRSRAPGTRWLVRVSLAVLAVLTVASVVDGILDAGAMRSVVGYARIAIVFVTVAVACAVLRASPARAIAFLACWCPIAVSTVVRALRDWIPEAVAGDGLDTMTLIGPTASVILFTLLASVDVQRREARLKNEVRRNAERFRAFAEIGTDAFWEIDRRGRLSFLAGNPAGLPGLALGDVFACAVARSTTEDAAASFKGAVDGHQPFDDCRLRLAESHERDAWISLSGRPIPQSGDPAETEGVYRGLLRDVTEEVDRESRRVIEQQMFALGQLAGSVAHEINNLIHPIINLTKRLRPRYAALEDRDGDRMLDLIDTSSRQAAKVVSELLHTMRGERLKDVERPIPIAVRQALEAVGPALPSTIAVELAIDSPDEPLVRVGDMMQVVGNLVSNSVHAMNGQGTITVALAEADGGVKLTVADDGAGMEERVRLRAMQPFFSTKTDGRGTGVGLYVVQRIVSDYGGRIAIESAPSDGTTVTIFFPVRKGDHVQ